MKIDNKNSLKFPFLLAGLLLIDALMIIFHFTLRQWLGFFDLDREGNLISLWTGLKLWSGAALVFLLAFLLSCLRAARTLEWLVWGALGLGLLWIGLDDMLTIHERLTFVLNNIFHTGGFYGESFNWLFYFAPLVLTALGVFYLAARSSERRAGTGRWFLVSVGFGLSALTTEIYGRMLILEPVIKVARYHRLIALEESFELVAATLAVFGIYLTVAALWEKHIRITD